MTTEITSADVEGLFDVTSAFGEKKVRLVEALVQRLYGGRPNEQQLAHEILNRLQVHPESWRLAGTILQYSQDPQTQHLALSLLEKVISTAWLRLPSEQREGIKQYVTKMSVDYAKGAKQKSQHKYLVNKINETLVQIVKREWPHHWPTFIADLTQAARTDSGLCRNALHILSLLAEEVTDFGDQMVSQKTEMLRNALAAELGPVCDLCHFVLSTAAAQLLAGTATPHSLDVALVRASLDCLAKFIRLLPFNVLFSQSDFIPLLVTYFYEPQPFRLDTMRVLCEIVALENLPPEALAVVQKKIWVPVASAVVAMDPNLIEFSTKCHVQTKPFYEAFWAQTTLFFTQLLRTHLTDTCEQPCEGNETGKLILDVLGVLVSLTRETSQTDASFKTLMEFWSWFAGDLVRDAQQGFALATNQSTVTANGGAAAVMENPTVYSQRLQVYQPVLGKLREVCILRMARPQEVLIRFDEETGAVEREMQTDTEEIALYNLMRETLASLTLAGPAETMRVLLDILAQLMQEAKTSQEAWNPNALSRLCWAVGSISDVMEANREKSFLVRVIIDLLDLCEHKRGKELKSMIVSMILYIFGQYPKFLRQYTRFLAVVIDKLVEFAQDPFPGVQDMTCETFLKVAKKCGDAVAVYEQDGVSLLDKLTQQVPRLYSLLSTTKQQLLLMEAYGHCVAGHPSKDKQGACLTAVLAPFLAQWQQATVAVKMNSPDVFTAEAAVKVTEIFRCCERLAFATGFSFLNILSGIYDDTTHMYRAYSLHTIQEIALKGEQQLGYMHIKALRGAKRAIIQLLDSFVVSSVKLASDTERERIEEHITKLLLRPVVDVVLRDYCESPPKLREVEVLGLLETIVNSVSRHALPYLSQIFTLTFDCTLDMIKTDFHSFPDHRRKFYDFVKVCVEKCAPDFLLQLPVSQRLAVVDCLIWAYQHEQPAVAETGLYVAETLLRSLDRGSIELMQGFCAAFYWKFLLTILDVTTDTLHKAGFALQASILRHLLALVGSGRIVQPGITVEEVSQRMTEVLAQNFKTLTRPQIEAFVVGMFSRCDDLQRFLPHLSDFLLAVKEYSNPDLV